MVKHPDMKYRNRPATSRGPQDRGKNSGSVTNRTDKERTSDRSGTSRGRRRSNGVVRNGRGNEDFENDHNYNFQSNESSNRRPSYFSALEVQPTRNPSDQAQQRRSRSTQSIINTLQMQETRLPSDNHYVLGQPPAVKSQFGTRSQQNGNRRKPRTGIRVTNPLQRAQELQGRGQTSRAHGSKVIDVIERPIPRRVRNLEEDSPGPVSGFLQAGLDQATSVFNSISDKIFNGSKRPSQQKLTPTNKRSRRTVGQDSLASTPPPADQRKRKREARKPPPKEQIIDLASDSDAPTEDESTPKKPAQVSERKSPRRQKGNKPAQRSAESSSNSDVESEDESMRKKSPDESRGEPPRSVYGMIHDVVGEVNEAMPKTPPAAKKTTPTKHALHGDDSLDSDDTGLRTQESFDGEKRQQQQQQESRKGLSNSAGETSEDDNTGGNQTQEDSDSENEGFSTFMPSGPIRKSKTTKLLQKAQHAAKHRKNPDLESMNYQQHQEQSKSSRRKEAQETKSKTPPQQETINILDDEDENDGGDSNIRSKYFAMQEKDARPRKELPHPGMQVEDDDGMKLIYGSNDGTDSKAAASSSLPSDLYVGDSTGNIVGMMKDFDDETGQWKNGAKPSAPLQRDRDDEGDVDFWNGITHKNPIKSAKNNSYSPDDGKISRMARKMAEDQDEVLANADEAEAPEIRNFARNFHLGRAGIALAKADKAESFSLTKHNNTVRRKTGTRIIPGASTTLADSQSPTSSQESRYFCDRSKARKSNGTNQSDYGTRSRSSQEKNDRDLAEKLQRQLNGYGNRGSSQFADSSQDPTNAQSGRTLRRSPRWSNSSSQEKSDWEMEQQQESLIASSTRKVSGRIPRKKKHATNAEEPIVLSSDSEEEDPADEQYRAYEYDLLRIALGKRVFGNNCQLTFSPRDREVTLEFCKSNRSTRNSNSEKESVRFTLNQDTLKVFKFYRKKESDGTHLSDGDDDEPFGTPADFNFMAIRVSPCNGSNNLAKYPNIYQPDNEEAPNKNRYIVFEFQEDEDFEHFQAEMEHHLAEIVPPGEIQKKESHKFGKVLIEHSRKMANSRMAKQSQSAFIKGRNSESTLLVFPFAGDPAQIEAAADGLQEPSGKLKTSRGYISDGSDEESDEQETRKQSNLSAASGDATDSNDEAVPKVKVRQHYVTLCVKDYERLQPEEWLNDSLIDFWMQWISRNEDKSNTNLHFFTSHFYSALSRDGPEAVTSWTAKKNINVFEKKFIFIPINKDLHWSQCVVVNPGCIANAYVADLDKKAKLDIPCLIFMDSLRMHKKTAIRKKIENWLNSEYERIHPDAEIPRPFDRDRFELFTPKVPMQNNTWDCGVFVCRYALAIYKLRNRSFTFRDVHGNSPFSRIVAGGAEFDFNMGDIVRFRGEFQKLIENLSRVYAKWKRGGEKANPKSGSEKKRGEEEASAERQKDEKETSDDQGMTDETKSDDNVAGSPSDESMDIVNENEKKSGEEEASAERQKDEKETSDDQGMTDETKSDDKVTGSPSDESMDIVNENESASLPYVDV